MVLSILVFDAGIRLSLIAVIAEIGQEKFCELIAFSYFKKS